MRSALEIVKSKLGGNLTGAEIGVGMADHAKDILENLPNLSKLYLVDPYINDMRMYLEHALYFTENYVREGKVKWILKTSEEASKEIDNESLDFVYIDADHEYFSVRRDIKFWWPKVKIGGLLCGHDFHPSEPGVMHAVNERFFGYDGFDTDIDLNGRDDSVVDMNRDWWVFKGPAHP